MTAAAKLWVEITDKAGAVQARERVTDDKFSIGRGYGNDLIIDDPTVSPEHLSLYRDVAGLWWVADLGSDNGTLDTKDQSAVSRRQFCDGLSLRIGETFINLRSSAFAVAATERVALRATPAAEASALVAAATHASRVANAAIVAMFLVSVLSALTIWLRQVGEAKLVNYAIGTFAMPFIALGWALVWALVTRIVSARGQFFRHLLIVSTAMVASIFIGVVVKYFDYAFALVSASRWESGVGWLVVAVLLILHLRLVTPNRLRIVIAVVGCLTIAAIVMENVFRDERERQQAPGIAMSILPSYFPTKTPTPTATLFDSITALKAKLDDERKKDPPSGSGADID